MTDFDDIQLAVAEGRLSFAPVDEIECYERLAGEFFATIFNLNYSECFISDISTLDDFVGAGSDAGETDEFESYTDYKDKWASLICNKINYTYGASVDIRDTVVSVLEKLWDIRKAQIS